MGCITSKNTDGPAPLVWGLVEAPMVAQPGNSHPQPHPLWDAYLLEQQARDLAVMDLVPVAVVIKDREHHRPVWANKYFLEMFKCTTLDEVMNKEFSKDSKATKLYEASLIAEFRAGRKEAAQCKVTATVNNTKLNLHVIYGPFTLVNGNMALLAVVLTDRAGMREREAFRAMEAVKRSHNVIVAYDKEGRPLLCSPRAELFLNRSSTDTSTDPFLPHVIDRTVAQQIFQRLKQSEDVHMQVDVQRRMQDGTTERLVHLIHGTTLTDPMTGQPMHLVTEDDVTEIARLSRLAEELAERLAVMDLEAAEDLCKKLTAQRKGEPPSALETALNTIVENLKQYRPFLPESLFLHSKDEDSDDEPKIENDTAVIPGRVTPNKPPNAGDKYVTPRGPKLSSRPSTASSSSSHSSNRHERTRKDVNLTVGLTRRQATLMEITLTGVDLNTLAIPNLAAVLSRYMDTVHQCVSAARGHVHHFNGARILCSWNATQNIASHAVKACRAAIDIRRVTRTWGTDPTDNRLTKANSASFPSAANALGVAIGIATGPLVVGNIGSARLKAFQTIGPVLTEARALSKQSHSGQRQTTLVSVATQQLAQHVFQFNSCTADQSFELLGELGENAGATEWMYTEAYVP